MNASQLIQTLVTTIVGGVVGGLIVITTNWITTKGKRRQEIKEWYEKTYVTEGIDPILIHLLSLGVYFYDKSRGGFVRVQNIDTIPVEAMVRLLILFDDGVVIDIISVCHALLTVKDKKLNSEAAKLTDNAWTALRDFRNELLEVIATQVRTKHYVVDVSQVLENLDEMRTQLRKLTKSAEYDQSVQ